MTLLGRVASGPIAAEDLEVWEVPGNVERVTFATEELQATCPVTGQPDTYHATITWDGMEQTIESKGMKHYLWSFRDARISCEDLAATIADSLARRLDQPVTVTLTQQVRGGLTLSCQATGRAS